LLGDVHRERLMRPFLMPISTHGLALTLDIYITPRHESEKDKNGSTDKINTHDSLLIYS